MVINNSQLHSPTIMKLIQKFSSIVAIIALASPSFAKDPDAAALEKQAVGFWAPNGEAMVKLYTEEKGMPKKDAEAVADYVLNMRPLNE